MFIFFFCLLFFFLFFFCLLFFFIFSWHASLWRCCCCCCQPFFQLNFNLSFFPSRSPTRPLLFPSLPQFSARVACSFFFVVYMWLFLLFICRMCVEGGRGGISFAFLSSFFHFSLLHHFSCQSCHCSWGTTTTTLSFSFLFFFQFLLLFLLLLLQLLLLLLPSIDL